MTTMRVTNAASAAQQIANIQASSSRLSSLENQLSSGNRITTASDDPTGTVTAMELNSQISRNGTYSAASTDALSRLSTQDSAYSQSITVLQNARTLVLQALNTGTQTSSSAQALGTQLTGLRSTLLSIANTTYDGQPVFGGTTSETAAYDSSGTYVGSSSAMTRTVADSTSVAVTAVGSQVFGSGSSDIFATLQSAATTLSGTTSSSSPTLSSDVLSSIDDAINRLSVAQTSEGSTYQQIQTLATVRTASTTAATSQLSSIQQTDIAQVAVQTQSANLAYQAALQTTAMTGHLSLLNFLQ